MTQTPRLSAAAALMVAALAMPAVSWAQAQTSPAPGPSAAVPNQPAAAPPVPTPHPNHHGHSFNLAQDVDKHISWLHAQLKVTPAQEPQWTQFAQVMRDNATAISKAAQDRSDKISAMNAVDSMTSYAQLAEQHAQDMTKLAVAFQTLYGSFSDEQKQAADTLFRRQAEQHKPHHAG